MTKLVFIHVPIRNMYFLSGMEGFKKSEGRSTRGASSLQYRLRPPPQSWMRPYDSCSSAPTALMKELSTANLLSIHVLILRIFVFGGATRIVGAGSCQSQIWLCTVVLLANPLPGASGLEKLTRVVVFFSWSSQEIENWKCWNLKIQRAREDRWWCFWVDHLGKLENFLSVQAVGESAQILLSIFSFLH